MSAYIVYIGSLGLSVNLEDGSEEFYEGEEISSIAINPDTYQSIGARNG